VLAEAEPQVESLEARPTTGAEDAQCAVQVVAAAPGAGCPFSGETARGVSRRRLIAGAASVAALPLIGKVGAAGAALPAPVTAVLNTALGAPLPGVVKWKHASDQRGLDAPAKLGPFTEARFGRMFKTLPAFQPPDPLLSGLAAAMNEQVDPSLDIPTERADNPDMPSGFIYLGQFIDHDMTHDLTPLGGQAQDPLGMTNFETPLFDLSCVYGGGPLKNPELFEADAKHMKLDYQNDNGFVDLPRHLDGSAIIADGRNDENLIICQLQIAFIQLHNYFLDHKAAGNFAEAKRLTIYHYQWIIVHDFLPHVVGQQLLDDMIFTLLGKVRAKTIFYRPLSPFKPMMPVEYSGAAYRWGHSGVRPEYEMHGNALSPNPAVLPIFDGRDPPLNVDLRGNRPLFADALIDWNYFYNIQGVTAPDDINLAHLIDTKVSKALYNLPDSVVAHIAGAILALPERNLLRGKRLGLPSGQAVAGYMKSKLAAMPTPLTNAQLDPDGAFKLGDPGWGGQAPLWFYCLRETELGGGTKLGPVQGRIVAEVILGLLQVDLFGSYWNALLPFTPVTGPTFNMGDMFKLIGARIIDPLTGQPINTPGAFRIPSGELDPPANPMNFAP